VINLDALVEAGMVGEQDIELLDFVDDAEEAWQRLADQGIGASPT
jgi:predicted Rossmann-fold nucleotide-binding protein